MDVPLAVVYALSLVLEHERVPVPGAVMSGLMRLLPSAVTGPRLLKPAIVSVPVLTPRRCKMLHKTMGDLRLWNSQSLSCLLRLPS